jgi:hypothetical protein
VDADLIEVKFDLCRKYETNIINNTIEKANENTLEE